MKVMIIHFIYN